MAIGGQEISLSFDPESSWSMAFIYFSNVFPKSFRGYMIHFYVSVGLPLGRKIVKAGNLKFDCVIS
jgi:hypothetical protein